MTERDEIQAKLLNAHGETQEKIDNVRSSRLSLSANPVRNFYAFLLAIQFVAELAKAVETKLNEAIEDLECRYAQLPK